MLYIIHGFYNFNFPTTFVTSHECALITSIVIFDECRVQVRVDTLSEQHVARIELLDLFSLAYSLALLTSTNKKC